MIHYPAPKKSNESALAYLAYLGRYLPQQCASDEFYFMPRSETALHYLPNLDDMHPARINVHLSAVKDFRKQTSGVDEGLEEEIDNLLFLFPREEFTIPHSFP